MKCPMHRPLSQSVHLGLLDKHPDTLENWEFFVIIFDSIKITKEGIKLS